MEQLHQYLPDFYYSDVHSAIEQVKGNNSIIYARNELRGVLL